MKNPNNIKFGNLTLEDFGKQIFECSEFLSGLTDALSMGELDNEDRHNVIALTVMPLIALKTTEIGFKREVDKEVASIAAAIEKRAAGIESEQKTFSIHVPANGIKS